MPQERTLLRPQIPHYRDMLSSCAPDPFGMTDEFEASGKCDSPDAGARHFFARAERREGVQLGKRFQG